MSSQSHQLNHIRVWVNPNEQKVTLYVALHASFVFAVKHVRRVFLWYGLLMLKHG